MTAPAIPQDDDVVKPVLDRRLLRRLLHYVRPYTALVIGAVLLLALEGATAVVGPWLTKRVIDQAIPARDLGSTGEGMIFAAELLQTRVLARP